MLWRLCVKCVIQALKVNQNNVTISLGLNFHHDYSAQENTQLNALVKITVVPYVVFTLY